MTAQDPPLVCQ